MTKNIVVCCDGTSNEFAKDHTNVVKLFSCLEKSERQVAYYHPGLGTMEPPGALTGAAIGFTKFLGLAIGYGLFNDVAAACTFLMYNYQPGDRVFLFGFSRGAYEARALASFLHLYGLIRRGNEALITYALRMMNAVNSAEGHSWGTKASAKKKAAANKVFADAPSFKRAFSIEDDCNPYFVGVWDTVSSVGLLSNPFHAPYTARNPAIQHGRHAMSMDERRSVFPVSRWFPAANDPNANSIKQVWFAGDHCDVGGGHPESQGGLSKIPFEWMLCEAVSLGLLVDARRFDEVMGYAPVMEARTVRKDDGSTEVIRHAREDFVPPDPKAKPHDSLNFSTAMGWIYHFVELFPRRKYDPGTKTWPWYWRPFHNKRVVPHAGNGEARQHVHAAVMERDASYRAALPDDVAFIKTAYPECLAGTVVAQKKLAWTEIARPG